MKAQLSCGIWVQWEAADGYLENHHALVGCMYGSECAWVCFLFIATCSTFTRETVFS